MKQNVPWLKQQTGKKFLQHTNNFYISEDFNIQQIRRAISN